MGINPVGNGPEMVSASMDRYHEALNLDGLVRPGTASPSVNGPFRRDKIAIKSPCARERRFHTGKLKSHLRGLQVPFGLEPQMPGREYVGQLQAICCRVFSMSVALRKRAGF